MASTSLPSVGVATPTSSTMMTVQEALARVAAHREQRRLDEEAASASGPIASGRTVSGSRIVATSNDTITQIDNDSSDGFVIITPPKRQPSLSSSLSTTIDGTRDRRLADDISFWAPLFHQLFVEAPMMRSHADDNHEEHVHSPH
jgi:hypothetical protein